MALQPSRLVLYSRQLSSCSARVRTAASLKNIPLEVVEYRPEGGARNVYNDSNYLEKNPNATVPTLEAYYENGESLVLTQSLSMLELLEESYSGGMCLIPPVTDMAARCKVRDLALLMACDTQPLQTTRFLNRLKIFSKTPALSKDQLIYAGNKATSRRITNPLITRVLADGMKVYEKKAETSAGTFSVGDKISIADVCLVAMIQGANRYGLSFGKYQGYPTIGRIVETCGGIDAFRQQGALVPGAKDISGSHASPLLWADKPAANWSGMKSGSTWSQESSPDIGSSKSSEGLLDRP